MFVVPTLSVVHHRRADQSPAETERQQRQIDQAGESLHRVMAAGVRVACGSDIGCFPHGDGSLQELGHLIALGLPAERALAAATSEAAALLGIPELGRIGVGAIADLAVFRSPETFELGATLANKPVAVYQRGRRVR